MVRKVISTSLRSERRVTRWERGPSAFLYVPATVKALSPVRLALPAKTSPLAFCVCWVGTASAALDRTTRSTSGRLGSASGSADRLIEEDNTVSWSGEEEIAAAVGTAACASCDRCFDFGVFVTTCAVSGAASQLKAP